MTDNTIIRPKTPRFGINEIVYFRESALLGYLEPAKVYRIRFDPEFNKNFYVFAYKKSAPNTQIAGDAIDLKSSKIIEVSEDEVLSYQEALDIKITSLERELIDARSKLLSSNGYPDIDIEEILTTEVTSAYDYNDVSIGSMKVKEFLITNTGLSDLILSSGIVLYGDDDFILESSPNNVISAGGSSTFSVRFAPSETGRRVCVVFVQNNSKNNSDFNFVLEGIGS